MCVADLDPTRDWSKIMMTTSFASRSVNDRQEKNCSTQYICRAFFHQKVPNETDASWRDAFRGADKIEIKAEIDLEKERAW